MNIGDFGIRFVFHSDARELAMFYAGFAAGVFVLCASLFFGRVISGRW